MSRQSLLLVLGLALSACGGNPAAPDDASAVQALVDRMTPTITVNGVAVQPGSPTNVAVGSMLNYLINYTNNSGQPVHTALVIVRDDGAARTLSCGASNSGGGGGGFGTGHTIFTNDAVYTPGHTVRVMLFAAFGPNVSGQPGPCYLESSPGVVNHAIVQAERLLATLLVQ